MAGLIISPRARLYHGHDWVYGSEVRKAFGDPQPGEVISLKDGKDRFLGSAIFNPYSQIVARRFSRRRQELDLPFFIRRLTQAIDYRKRIGTWPGASRLVWSESDALPGVIIDAYGKHVVLQTLTLAMDMVRPTIEEAIRQVLEPESILVRNDAPIRAAEGMEPFVGFVYGNEPAPFEMELRGIRFQIDLRSGQKTGLYLDQIDNYAAVAKYAKGKRVLDCFSNQGGFALACALAGAESVTAVDVSEDAIDAVSRNAELNNVHINAIATNAFDFLKEKSLAARDETEYDLIILDPPSFARNKNTLRDAMRGYKEIHLRALKMLPNGGIMSTFCCSHHASREIYWDNVCEAAVDAPATLRLMASHEQRLDHPVIATLPETEYLKGFTFELLPGR